MGAPAGAAGPVTTARLGSAIAGGMIFPMDAVRLTKWAFAAGTTAPWDSFRRWRGPTYSFLGRMRTQFNLEQEAGKGIPPFSVNYPGWQPPKPPFTVSVSQTKLALPLSLSRFL